MRLAEATVFSTATVVQLLPCRLTSKGMTLMRLAEATVFSTATVVQLLPCRLTSASTYSRRQRAARILSCGWIVIGREKTSARR